MTTKYCSICGNITHNDNDLCQDCLDRNPRNPLYELLECYAQIYQTRFTRGIFKIYNKELNIFPFHIVKQALEHHDLQNIDSRYKRLPTPAHLKQLCQNMDDSKATTPQESQCIRYLRYNYESDTTSIIEWNVLTGKERFIRNVKKNEKF